MNSFEICSTALSHFQIIKILPIIKTLNLKVERNLAADVSIYEVVNYERGIHNFEAGALCAMGEIKYQCRKHINRMNSCKTVVVRTITDH